MRGMDCGGVNGMDELRGQKRQDGKGRDGRNEMGWGTDGIK